MTTTTVTEAYSSISQDAEELVTVLSTGQHGVKAGFAKRLFEGVDAEALLETNIDEVFDGLNPLAGGRGRLEPTCVGEE